MRAASFTYGELAAAGCDLSAVREAGIRYQKKRKLISKTSSLATVILIGCILVLELLFLFCYLECGLNVFLWLAYSS